MQEQWKIGKMIFFEKNVRVRKSEVKDKQLPEIDKSIVHLYDDNNCRIWYWAESFLVPKYLLFCSNINLFCSDITWFCFYINWFCSDINLIILCFNLRPDCSWPHRYSSGCLQYWSEETNLYLSTPRAENTSHQIKNISSPSTVPGRYSCQRTMIAIF